MVAEKFYNSPISFTSQFYFCPVPLRLDTYSGCLHQCIYCFANNSQQKYVNVADFDFNNTNLPILRTKLETVKKYFDVAFNGKKNTFSEQEAVAIECMKRKVPMHFGGMSDPLQPCETKYGITYDVLKLLKEYDYPYVISTKGKLLLEPKYHNLILDTPKAAVQISLIDYRQEVLDILEPNAATAEERFKMFDILGKKWTACRIQPLIPFLNEPILENLIQKLKIVGCNHVMIEGMKFMSGNKKANLLFGEAFRKITGKDFDIAAYYKSMDGKHSGNDLELPTWRKWEYVKPAKKWIESQGMTFGCADNDLRFMSSDSINPCCCGVTELPGFEGLLKHNTGYACKRAKEQNCKITQDLIKDDWHPQGRFRQIISVETLRKRLGPQATSDDANKPVKQLFDNQWNNCGKNSPCQQANVEFKGAGVYKLMNQAEFENLMDKKNFKQKFLGDFK